jgi:metallo-beta-lactamase class B
LRLVFLKTLLALVMVGCQLIAENHISTLGFHLSDVKFLLNSHARCDHCGRLTELKRRSGAKMIASEGDSTATNGSRQLNCSDRERSFPAVGVDRVIVDNETVQPRRRHADGAYCAWPHQGLHHLEHAGLGVAKRITSCFIPALLSLATVLSNNPEYPAIASHYEQTFANLRHLRCDVFLAPHGTFFHRDDKVAALQHSRKDAFVDPADRLRVTLRLFQSPSRRGLLIS